MGIACRQPNTIGCDRVGLAVWSRRPARAVHATIAGRRLSLDDREWSARSDRGLRRGFAGFLQHAGPGGAGPLAVRPGHRVSATVRLTITYANGTQQATKLRIGLAPGWG